MSPRRPFVQTSRQLEHACHRRWSCLEKKVDVGQRIKDHPWPALAIAFGAGLALSSTGAGGAAAGAAQKTTSKVASALDDILGDRGRGH